MDEKETVTGTWGSDPAYSYQWFQVREWDFHFLGYHINVRKDKPIRGATEASYVVTQDDAGWPLAVTATNGQPRSRWERLRGRRW